MLLFKFLDYPYPYYIISDCLRGRGVLHVYRGRTTGGFGRYGISFKVRGEDPGANPDSFLKITELKITFNLI